MKYVDVILPLPLNAAFTYAVSEDYSSIIQIGMRVVVPFGNKKMYTGIVILIHSNTPTRYQAKDIIALLDEKPILRFPQLKFWQWISNYYLSALGEVYQAAIPSGLKLESETEVRINADFTEEMTMSKNEFAILDYLSDGKTHKISELNSALKIRNTLTVLKSLIEKNAIEISEELQEKYKKKYEVYVCLTNDYSSEKQIQNLFEKLNAAKKQLELLMFYLEQSKFLSRGRAQEVAKKTLLEKSGISPAILNSLIDRNVFFLYKKEVGRLDNSELKTEKPVKLADFQQKALQEIKQAFLHKQVVLLHGVTSSGKTEIYVHLIMQMLEQRKQVLFLVPEIALTTQLTWRMKQIFGNKLGIYHSKFSDAERVEIWNHLLDDGGYEVIIGVRSSVFLPFRSLGLVIVDEEHETSYKQFDPAPRYHARNAAIILASMHGAKTLLGSATPSIESYFNAITGKFGLVEIKTRFMNIELPEILLANTHEAYRKKQMEGHFTPLLLKNINNALESKEQVILFQNRRGYAPYIECKACHFIPKCKNCDVSLTVHKFTNKLTCHYCGYTENLPTICPNCNTPHLTNRGFGTEMIEQEIEEHFTHAKTARLDLDTTRSKKSYERIIRDFEIGKINILVGTQMITKGLDFEKVSLVGILNADNLLNFPDFRAHERAFQLLTQVSGRAGRKVKRGRVIIQTSNPEHPVIGQVMNNDYIGMFNTQCEERKLFHYPPFYRLIQITLRHKDINTLERAAQNMTDNMRKVFGTRVLGPNEPLISMIQKFHIRNILLKFETTISYENAKNIVRAISDELVTIQAYKSVKISIDIDPM